MPNLPSSVSRRAMLRTAGVAGAMTIGAGATKVFASSRVTGARPSQADLALLDQAPICRVADAGPAIVSPTLRKLKLTWNANAICTVGVPVADKHGLFAKHGLDVELINFGGSTDQLLEAISTGKADAGVGMALRWLKPLEQGFDVKITTAIHGGCMRLFAAPASGINGVADLKGKTVGVSDMAAPDKNFFSILAAKQDLDPNADIDWRQYPADLLGVALKKGEIQAFSLGDPLAWVVRDRDGLHEIANNLTGEYQHRACCVLGVRGSLVREDRVAAGALTQALLEAQEFVANRPDEAAALFAAYSPTPTAQLAAMLRSHTHHHHPVGQDLRQEIAAYADELKLVQVIKQSTNTAKFADKVYANVLTS
jgi:NitT/TauT family transport system substrate-binding protein